MSWLFAKQKTPQEMMREHQRALRKSMREMDRERTTLQRQEKQITLEIRKMAKQGQMNAARIMAKDLVRTRANIQKFYRMKSQLQAVSLRIQTVKSTAAMANAMYGVTRAMASMNQAMNLPAMQRIMMEFEKQTEVMEMKEEMMEDTMDDMFEMEEDEDMETDEVLNKVLDEIGIDIGSQLASTPQNEAAPAQAEAAKAQPQMVAAGDDDLMARVNHLKNG
mmetsp:Transcript_12497/g.50027  ORF Transcript_12497/g.50027 Transcript_12497/m.50027 type:complete len:221 (-) Transcript_12497:67-729(-)